MRIVLTGGGSGGHLFPLIAVAQEIRKIADKNKIVSVDFIYLGAEVREINIFEKEFIQYKFIIAGKFRRYASIYNIIDFFKLPIGIIQSFFILFFIYPDAIFSKGGFGAYPVVVAGWLLRIPIIIHESDSVPGLSNKWSAKFAKRIAVSFPKTITLFSAKKTGYTGNPVRTGLVNGSKDEAKQMFNLIGMRPIILVLGGSQGSEAINDAFLRMLPKLLNKYELIHQTGGANYSNTLNESRTILSQEQQRYYHPIGFMEEREMANAYACCDIIISRAGANSIFEIAMVGKPSIIIPLPSAAGNHQVINAHEFSKSGAAVIIEQANFYPGIVETKINSILANPDIYQSMALSARKFSKDDATYIIANETLKLTGLV